MARARISLILPCVNVLQDGPASAARRILTNVESSPVFRGPVRICWGIMSAGVRLDLVGRTVMWRWTSARIINARMEGHVWLLSADTRVFVCLDTQGHTADGDFLLVSVMWICSVRMEAFAVKDHGEPTVPADQDSLESGVSWI